MDNFRLGMYLLAEILLRLCLHPRLRSRILSALGAEVGVNVRIYECRFMNLQSGFSTLKIGDDVHIGTDCLIDLAGPVVIGDGAVLSPRVNLLSHTDPGSAHSSPLCVDFPPERLGVVIGKHCWIGASSTILSGSSIGERTVVGAAALVRGHLDSGARYAGVPARRIG